MERKILSRKFGLAVALTAAGIVALFLGKLTGGEYVALATLVLSAYGAANVMEKR